MSVASCPDRRHLARTESFFDLFFSWKSSSRKNREDRTSGCKRRKYKKQNLLHADLVAEEASRRKCCDFSRTIKHSETNHIRKFFEFGDSPHRKGNADRLNLGRRKWQLDKSLQKRTTLTTFLHKWSRKETDDGVPRSSNPCTRGRSST